MKNVEKMMFDKNDPYLQLKFGANTWSYKTEVLQDAGSDPTWTYNIRKHPQMKFTVALEELGSGAIAVCAMDANSITSDAFIGGAEAKLPPQLVPKEPVEGKVEAEVTVELVDAKGKATGTVMLTVERESYLKNKPAAVSALEDKADGAVGAGAGADADKKVKKPFTHGQLLVTKIVCKDLTNVESFGGKDDPYVVLQLGAETRKTEVLEEGGSNVCFDYLDIAFDVEKDVIDFENMSVQVWDKNSMTAHKLIGQTSTGLRPLLSKVGEEVDISLQLSTDKKADTGSVIIFFTLKETELEPADKVDAPLDPTFQSGILHINRIRAFELKDTKATFSSHVANPYVKLTLGGWKHQTQTVAAKQGPLVFDHLDLEVDVTAASLQADQLQVEVYDDETMMDALIGTGACSVRAAGVKLNEEQQFTVDLVRDGKSSGRLVLYA